MTWEVLGACPSTALIDVRLQAHWASQVLTGVADAFLYKRPDDSHTALTWLPRRRLLAGPVRTRRPSFRFALQPATLTLMALDPDGKHVAALPLAAHKLDDAYEWAGFIAGMMTGRREPHLPRRDYEMPRHRVAEGWRFDTGNQPAYEELSRWFANAAAVLTDVATRHPAATPVRCWPHHFDVATLLTVDPDGPKTVGVGLSPGDGTYPEPYWYVSPWPYPDHRRLPPLGNHGFWHVEGFCAAILKGSESCDGDAATQHQTVDAFLADAIPAAIAALTS